MLCEGDFDRCLHHLFGMIRRGDRSMVVMVMEESTGKCRLYRGMAGAEELRTVDLDAWRVLFRMTLMEIWGLVCWPFTYFYGEEADAVH